MCSIFWIWALVKELGLTDRAGTTAGQKLPTDWPELQSQLRLRLAYMVQRRKIPRMLVINWDQSGVPMVMTGNRRYAKKNAKDVAIAGKGEKRQVGMDQGMSVDYKYTDNYSSQ